MICEVIGALQAHGPVVVLIDDAQWADRPSLHALGYVLRRLRAGRVLVVVAVRDVADPWLPCGSWPAIGSWTTPRPPASR
ncbi:ATP-binding protein [Nonomuraea sp. NBC_00507]|uniref:hypothetical protein n=1 Tax=Nonomuraea sp. NBC_00507 TaxID=2976002 RepID=UPI002E17F9CD